MKWANGQTGGFLTFFFPFLFSRFLLFSPREPARRLITNAKEEMKNNSFLGSWVVTQRFVGEEVFRDKPKQRLKGRQGNINGLMMAKGK